MVQFSNPIIGEEELIRSAIRSQDYVAGTSGWRIAADGSAEFSDVVLHGSGTGAVVTVGVPPNPQVVLESNSNFGRIAFPTNGPVENLVAAIAAARFNAGFANEYESLELIGPAVSGATNYMRLQLNSQNNDGSSNPNVSVFANSGGLRFAVDSVGVFMQGAVNAPGDIACGGILTAGNKQSGITTHVFSAVSTVDVSVTFATTFAAAPQITAIMAESGTLPAGTSSMIVRAFNVTTTGMTVRVNDTGGVARTATVHVHWKAETF